MSPTSTDDRSELSAAREKTCASDRRRDSFVTRAASGALYFGIAQLCAPAAGM
jgi:hypothetical protein